MAIINCPECGKNISDRSKTCVHCGYPLAESYALLNQTKKTMVPSFKKKHLFFLFTGLVVVFIIVAICGMFGPKNIAQIKGNWKCADVSVSRRYSGNHKIVENHTILNVSSSGDFALSSDDGTEYKGKLVFQEIKHNVSLEVDGKTTKPDVYTYSLSGDEIIECNEKEELSVNFWGTNIHFQVREKESQMLIADFQFKRIT